MGFPGGSEVKSLPSRWETRVRSLGQEDPLEKEIAIHSSILAWEIPWMEEPSRLQSMGSQRVGQDWATSLSLLMIVHSFSQLETCKALLTISLPKNMQAMQIFPQQWSVNLGILVTATLSGFMGPDINIFHLTIAKICYLTSLSHPPHNTPLSTESTFPLQSLNLLFQGE